MDDETALIIAISIVAEMDGHRLAGWTRAPDGTRSTYCRRCYNTVWLTEDVISFLGGPCEAVRWLLDSTPLDKEES